MIDRHADKLEGDEYRKRRPECELRKTGEYTESESEAGSNCSQADNTRRSVEHIPFHALKTHRVAMQLPRDLRSASYEQPEDNHAGRSGQVRCAGRTPEPSAEALFVRSACEIAMITDQNVLLVMDVHARLTAYSGETSRQATGRKLSTPAGEKERRLDVAASPQEPGAVHVRDLNQLFHLAALVQRQKARITI
ncbi:MAG TPA: hypothetical protein VJS38_05530 [Phenylobacterium sp.]|uniref:hypothetical protein n=1 Tax=Phenylobacterium sp. TaxID=1871053 RepID=UPI002B48B82E|nr:hypothetical protein [Phenylobacterium sp.]HKR87617.1 hypothetical protein [Phenylobacterium sp.]